MSRNRFWRAALAKSTALGSASLMILAVLPDLAQAQTVWDGSDSTNWFNDGNWSAGAPTAGVSATIDATMPNSAVISGGAATSGTIDVGALGTGTLLIENGATLTSSGGPQSRVGFNAGANGTVTVTDTGSMWTLSHALIIGRLGIGSLTVADSGQVNSSLGVVGDLAGSQGTALITGPGSSWNNAGNLFVGNFGEGEMTIANGGSVTSLVGGVGGGGDAVGTVTVDGIDSHWTISNALNIGNLGSGTLTIEGGGSVTSDTATLGLSAGGQGTATVDGIGSALSVGGELIVGTAGSGTLDVIGGGMVNAIALTIADAAGSQGAVTVAGGAGLNAAPNTLRVGSEGAGSLTIEGGGVVTSGSGFAGIFEDATGDVIVSGPGSRWDMNTFLTIGQLGTATLRIADGGVVTSNSGELASLDGSQGTATVTGDGSAWNMAASLVVGNFGMGALDILAGGSVTSATGFVGGNASGAGTVLVSGADAVWDIGGDLTVGVIGTGALTIAADAALVVGGSVTLARNGPSAGTLNIGAAAGDATAAPGTLDAATVAFGAGAGTINFNHTGTDYEFAPAVSGDGSVNVLAGTTIFTADNSYTGVTTIAGGATLRIGNGGGTGSLASDVANNGALIFDRTGTLAYGGNISGGGLFSKTGAGALTLSGDNTYTGGTRILAGILGAEGGNAIGDQSSVIAQAGQFRVLDSESIGTLSGNTGTVELAGADLTTSTNLANVTALFFGGITGTGALIKNGAYRQVLAGDNSYQGATQILGGTLSAVGAGIDSIPNASAVTVASGATLSLVQPFPFAGLESDDETIGSLSGAGNVNLGNRTLTIDGAVSTTFSGEISGAGGSLIKAGTGTLTLSGASTYTGATNVNGGTLMVEGSLGDTATAVADGATLGGSGSIAGDVTVQDGGTLAPGSSAGTLTLGSLSLSGGSVLDYELGQAGEIGGGVNDLIEVTGNLILDGTLNITDIGGFGPGVYRLMNYGGDLTDHVLELGGLPTGVDASDLYVQTRITGQVNLINSAGAALNFWDGGDAALHDNGANEGGDGIWDAASRNWTEADGMPNGQWNQDFAIFGGAAGTVTIDNSAGDVQFTGMQFMSDGYVVEGDALTTNTAETIIRVDAGVTAEIGAEIAGSGGLVKQDTGTLVLTGANSYTGGTSILNGTLEVSADANLGAASGNLTLDGGTLRNTAAFTTARDITLNAGGGTFRTDADLTAAGVVSGAGALTKIGGGALTLTGANTYAGGTAVSQGRVTAAVTGALGTGPLTIDAGSGGSAFVDFAGSANAESLAIGLADPDSYLSFLQNASAGDAAINNSGRINFYNDSSAGGATITNFGPGTSFNDNSTAGDATIINNAGSPLNFYHQASAGNATIINNGGFTIFNGDNTADGATITNNGGVVDISPLTTAGIGIGSLSGTGAVFLGSKILTLGGLGENGTVSGVLLDGGIAGGTGGALTKVGTGTLTLTGANSYTGGTMVQAGTLDIGGGATTGSIAGDVEVAAGGTLAFNRSDDFTFAGLIGGDGTVEKLAAGTLTLTSDSDAFAGRTSVNAGTLAVNGTLGGVVDVLSGARLEGTGTVGTTTIATGGTIAPGNSIDTLSVAGDITFAAGSIYEVEIEPDLDGDLIDASGAATIDGGTVHVLKTAGTYTPGSRWTIVSADGGVAGEFDDLTQNMPFVDLELAYDPNNVYLDVTRNDVSFCDVALTFNQCSTGDGVESTGPGTPIYDAVAAIPDEESARRALDALSGEIHASIKGAFLEDSRFVREAMLDRTRAALGGVAAPSLPVMGYGESLTPEQQEALAREGKSARVFAPAPADTDRFAVWARGFGSWGEWDSDGNAADFERATGGIFVGADAAVAETWRVGLVTGYSRSSFHADDRASSGDSDNYHLGLFAGTSFGNLGLSLGAAHTWHDIETGRSIAFPGFADSAETSYDARTAQIFGELGYRIDRGGFAFEPFGNLAYVNVDTDGFAEDGGAAALTGAGGTTDATFTTLGLRASTNFRLGEMTATARGMLGWRHAFGDTVPNSTHAFAGGDAFTIAGTPIAEDALVLEAGLDVGLSQKTSLGLSYSGQIGNRARDHGFRADLSVKF